MASRKKYIDKLEKQLREWNKKIDVLQEKANQRSDDLKRSANKRLESEREAFRNES